MWTDQMISLYFLFLPQKRVFFARKLLRWLGLSTTQCVILFGWLAHLFCVVTLVFIFSTSVSCQIIILVLRIFKKIFLFCLLVTWSTPPMGNMNKREQKYSKFICLATTKLLFHLETELQQKAGKGFLKRTIYGRNDDFEKAKKEKCEKFTWCPDR